MTGLCFYNYFTCKRTVVSYAVCEWVKKEQKEMIIKMR